MDGDDDKTSVDINTDLIESHVKTMFKQCAKFKKNNRRYTLLLCRMIGEAYLTKKFFEDQNSLPSDEYISLGTIENPKFSFKKILSHEEKLTLQYIQKCTNTFLHYNPERQMLKISYIDKAIAMLREIWNIQEQEDKTTTPSESDIEMLYNKLNDCKTVKEKNLLIKKSNINWRQMLPYELSRFDWPAIGSTILSDKYLRSEMRKKHNSKKIKKLLKQLISLSPQEKIETIKSLTESMLLEYYRIIDSRRNEFNFQDRVFNGKLLFFPMKKTLVDKLKLDFSGQVINVLWDGTAAREKWAFLCKYPKASQHRKKEFRRRFQLNNNTDFRITLFVRDWNFIYFKE